MKRLFISLGVIAVMASPAAAAAAPAKVDKREGKRECRQLQRVVETRANFVQVVKLEARANRRNAFGRCVRVRTRAAASERRAAFKAAKQACASLRPGASSSARPESAGRPPFAGRPSDPGAYGRCVSAAARSNRRESDAEQREATLNPARTCRKAQEDNAAAYKALFPGKNGFGKCVSTVARAQADQDETPEPAPAA